MKNNYMFFIDSLREVLGLEPLSNFTHRPANLIEYRRKRKQEKINGKNKSL